MTSRPSTCGDGAAAALTTPFAVPAGCKFPLSGYTDLSCLPPNYNTMFWCDGFYSPGVCPSGYFAARSHIPDASYDKFTLKPGESAVNCCPSSYSPGTGALWKNCFNSRDGLDHFDAIQIRWRSSDIPLLSPYLGQATLVAAGITTGADLPSSLSSTATGTSPPRASENLGSQNPPRRKSRKTTAGIVAGIICGLTLVAIGIFTFLRRRRRQRQAGNVPDTHHADGKDAPEVVTEPIEVAQSRQGIDTGKILLTGAREDVTKEPRPGAVDQSIIPELSGTPKLVIPELSTTPVMLESTHRGLTNKQVAQDSTLEVAPTQPELQHAVYESGLEVVSASSRRTERSDLEAELISLQARKQHLVEMRAIEEEEERVRRRLAELN